MHGKAPHLFCVHLAAYGTCMSWKLMMLSLDKPHALVTLCPEKVRVEFTFTGIMAHF